MKTKMSGTAWLYYFFNTFWIIIGLDDIFHRHMAVYYVLVRTAVILLFVNLLIFFCERSNQKIGGLN